MHSYLVGIAGGTASGKTTLAKRLFEHASDAQVAVIELDRYYRCQDEMPMSSRITANYDHPDSLEFELLVQHLQKLQAGITVQTPVCDFENHTRCKQSTITVAPRPIIVVEGILIFAVPKLCELFGTRIFVDAPSDLRLSRRIERDVRERGRTRESVLQQWNSSVEPMHQAFCEPSRSAAHIIFDGSTCYDAPLDEMWQSLQAAASRDNSR
jgi:uridine kinase